MSRNRIMSTAFAVLLILSVFIAFPGGPAQAASNAKHEIVVAFGQDIVTFDTHNYRGTQDIIASAMVYDTLVEMDNKGEIVPALAESWEWVSPNELKFNLRKGVKFHGGEPFNSECVKFSIERNNAGSGTAYSNFVTEVRVIDDYTVIFYMENPYGPALPALSNPIVAMMSPSWVAQIGDKIVEQTNGTGPFILKEFNPGSRAVFEKNADYWGEKAALDRVEFRPIPEVGTRVMALKSKEVDVIENPSPWEVASIEADKDLYLYTSPKMRTLFWGFNLTNDNVGKKENKALREAIAYAIDTNEIAEGVLEGLAMATEGDFFPPAISGGFSDLSYVKKFDLEKAKKIVKDNNLEGKNVTLWCTRGRYLLDTETAEVIQAQVARAGIKVNIVVMEYGPMMTAVTELKQEMFQLAWGWNSGDASTVFRQIFTSDAKFNGFGTRSAAFDDLVKTGATYPERKDRMKYYNEALKYIIDEEVALVPIVHYMNVYAANKKVQGLYASPTELLLLKYAYMQ